MELREKIAKILDPVIVQWDDGDPLKFADLILALPEIRDGQRAMEAIARQGLELLDDGSIGREYKARS